MGEAPGDSVPPGLARTVAATWGAEGRAWLGRFPALLADLAARWQIRVGPPLDGLSYNYVAPARLADGGEAILKLGVPNRELRTEIEALRLYDGRGAVRLLAADAGAGALLLERLRPGTPLLDLADDEAATEIAAGVMGQLWRPLPAEHAFPSVADWAAGLGRLRARYGGGSGPLPPDLVAQAEALFDELIASMAAPVLLHGDLHHWNIVAAGRQPWLAIDPKGVAGEPAYEVGALLRNPWPGLLASPQPGRLQARRLELLAERLGFDRARLAAWGLAQAVLSAWWSLEDGQGDWRHAVGCARLLAEML
jgi:streptomycin 6-kinase